MTKEEYIQSLDEIVKDEIFITSETDLLEKEISENFWTISVKQEIANQLNVEELLNVIARIKSNRREQLSKSSIEIDLIFYMWHDDQASQLRFNFINSNHLSLPFGTKVKLIKSESQILSEFLKDNHHDGIGYNELKEIEKNENGEFPLEEKFQTSGLNVYKELIKQ